ncbi:MAG: hypothetical protein EBS96_07130 [Spartobacteria bacterium]|nr:hypothetical protein [Spartobacteria bacterium]
MWHNKPVKSEGFRPEKCIFFARLARNENRKKCPLKKGRKKGSCQVKKNPPSPQAGRGGNF